MARELTASTYNGGPSAETLKALKERKEEVKKKGGRLVFVVLMGEKVWNGLKCVSHDAR